MRIKNQLSSAIFAMAWMIGSSASAQQHTHEYVNGICTDESCSAPGKYEEPTQAEDGFYELRNAGNVEWFGYIVSQGNATACARMMNDIDFEGKENLHSPIGPDEGHKFDGTWDGQGHRVTNMIINLPEKTGVGFFCMLRGNGPDVTIKNFIIDKTCSITGMHKVGAFAGCTQNVGCKLIMENLINEADVTAVNGSDAGAIVGGRHNGNAPTWRIRNCVNTGKITAGGYAGAIAGWMGDNASNVIENFINLGVIEGFNGESNMVRTGGFAGNVKNLIDLSETEGAVQGVREDLTVEDIANGKLAFVANGDQKQINFYQTLGEDGYPVPFATSRQVYFNGHIACDGTPLEGSYSNTEAVPTKDDHVFEAGDFYCTVCGAIDTAFCEKADTAYVLKTAKDFEWFSAMVSSGHNHINGYLANDVDMAEATDFQPIGTLSNLYQGSFDGGFHTISNLDLSAQEGQGVGLFGEICGGTTIKNLRLDETCIISGSGSVGLIGRSRNAGDIFLTNLAMEGEVLAMNNGAGGILGGNTGSKAKVYMSNCYSKGYVTGGGESGALSGWLGNNGPVVTNCWSSAEVSGTENDGKYLFRHNNATMTNCYSVYGTQGNIIDAAEVENGSLCYKLNGDQTDITWWQNLDEDAAPTFMPGHKQVYPGGQLNCDGSFDVNEMTFSNDPSGASIKPHNYVDGFCSECNHENPDYPFIRSFANADHDITSGYTTNNSNDGSKLAINNSVAEHWNMHHFDTYQTLRGLQKGVYKLRVQGLQRVCAWDNNGDEYGTGLLNEEYIPLYHSSQFYAQTNGIKVAGLFMDITKGAYEESVKETENFNEYTGMYVPNSLAACNKVFRKGGYWNEPLYFYVASETDSVNIGVENKIYKYGNWTVWDTWRLEYVGDDTDSYELIRRQQIENISDLGLLDAQTSLMEAYSAAQEDIQDAGTLDEILTAANTLSTAPLLIRESHLAYEAYEKNVEAVRAERANHDNLLGYYADLLESYLEDNEAEVEGLPNGTYYYIMEEKPLSAEELSAEAAFLQDLLLQAIKTSIAEGADVSNLMVNPNFTEDSNFKGWTTSNKALSSAGSNFKCNTGFTDIYPVTGTWNTSFDVYQDLQDEMPNGIYMLEVPAFFRPGGNGIGEADDFVTSTLYINGYHTPVMNIYAGEISYADAINGVNCRYDASGDPEAPHNGEKTSSQDYDTGTGYVPEDREATSFAFGAGRYMNKVYGIVTDNSLRVGIRNTGVPYYESELTLWGKFRLVYMGQSEEAMAGMISNFESSLKALKHSQQQIDPYIFSHSHINAIEGLISEIKTTGDIKGKMEIAGRISEEFNAVYPSYQIYSKLQKLMEYCYEKGDSYLETDPELYELFISLGEQIQDHVYTGDLTDEEAKAYYESILNKKEIGGGVFAQGDLLDSDGNDLPYDSISTIYPLTKNAEGKYVGRIKVQNRANKPNTQGRAGFYFSFLNSKIKTTVSTRNFVTPATNTFDITQDGGSDFQTVGGVFDVTLDLDNGTATFDAVEYNWSDDVFVVGSVLDDEGQPHRWKNDEMCQLHHQGGGVYEGDVTFYTDPNHLNEGKFLTFTIFATRATTGLHEFTKNSQRTSWTEARYGSETNALRIENDMLVTDAIRGADRQWWLPWPNDEEESALYHITFNMNERTMGIHKLTEDEVVGVDEIKSSTGTHGGAIYNLSGQRVSKTGKGIYIMDGKKVLVK